MYYHFQKKVKNLIEIDFSSLYHDMAQVYESGLMKNQERRTMYEKLCDLCTYFPFWTELVLEKSHFKQFLRQVKCFKTCMLLADHDGN